MVLVGYWPLNEDSGDTAYDHSGNENHGTINDGGDSTLPGATGILNQNAYSFDGNNDYVEIPHSDDFSFGDTSNNGQSRTISMWVYFDSVSSYQELINKDDYGGTRSWNIGIFEDGELRWFIKDGDGSGSQMDQNVYIESNKWYHLSFVYDGSTDADGMNIFVDGSVPNDMFIVSNDISSVEYTEQTVWIGDVRGKDRNIDARIQEVRVYNHALTPSEIQYLYSVSQRGSQTTSKKTS